MIPRRILPALTSALDEASAVALLGPRQAGKTTLALDVARARPAVYLDLESDADRAKLSEPEHYLSQEEGKLALLGIGDLDVLLAHPVAGGSWEGLAIESLIAAASERPGFPSPSAARYACVIARAS